MQLISVVMPTFNRASVLSEAIRSVLEQTYRDFELIVVDDGSEDDTAAVVNGIADERLRFHRSERNRGGNWARNRGIEHARGEILSFLDSDDAFLPHKLSIVADFFAKNPKIDVLVDSYLHKTHRGPKAKVRRRINPVVRSTDEFRASVFGRVIRKATSGINARRRALLEVDMFDETLRRRQDMDLVLRLSREHECRTTDQISWIKHTMLDSISKTPTFLPATIEICKRHPEYLDQFRRPLDRNVRHHFVKLLRRGHWRDLARDIDRYRAYEGFDKSLLRLALGV